MSIDLTPADSRGRTLTSWLDSRHSFSFGSYYDPMRTGFGPLLVINDDRVAPGGGFATHGHRDMEILTYVVSGALLHRDDTGSEGTVAAGDMQRMSAGTGIRHSEWNASKSEALRFLQIWIEPEREGLAPGYEQRSVAGPGTDPGPGGALQLVASGHAAEGVLVVHRDVEIFLGRLGDGTVATHEIARGRGAWVQVVNGNIDLDGQPLLEGDGAALRGPATLSLKGHANAELLLFDLPLRG
jgi:quercetin 2,3-dioxygenase